MAKEACRGCDGRGSTTTTDRENVFSSKTKVCSRCGGRKVEPGPPKGEGKRRFFGAPKSEDDDNDLNRAGDAFLRRHGFGKNGR